MMATTNAAPQNLNEGDVVVIRDENVVDEARQAPNPSPPTGGASATAAPSMNNTPSPGLLGGANQKAVVHAPNVYTLGAVALPATAGVLAVKVYYGAILEGLFKVLDRVEGGAKSIWKTAFITLPLGGLVISWMIRYPGWTNRENIFHQQEIQQGLSVPEQERNCRRRKFEMTCWLLGEVVLVLSLSFYAKMLYDHIILGESFYGKLLPMPNFSPKDDPQLFEALKNRPIAATIHPMFNNFPFPVTVICKHTYTGKNIVVQTLQPGESFLARVEYDSIIDTLFSEIGSIFLNLTLGIRETITTEVILPNQLKGTRYLPNTTTAYTCTSTFFSIEQFPALGVSARVFPN